MAVKYPGLPGAGLIAGGGILGNITSNIQQGVTAKKNRENQLELQKNDQNFQEMMASTNLKRQFNQMEDAGINKSLALGNQGQTSAPSRSSQSGSGSGGSQEMEKMMALLQNYMKTGKRANISKVRTN